MTGAIITRDPGRLAALCALWQSSERDVWITLQGYSMNPTIPPGSRLRLLCHQRAVYPGEILAFRRDNILAIHRLVEIVDGPEPGTPLFICRGDGNSQNDAPIGREEVVGTIVEIRPSSRFRRSVWRWLSAARRRLGPPANLPDVGKRAR